MGDCLMITEPTTGVAKPVGVIGGSGHDIINSAGTAMAQEDGLQFASGCVEDDPVNGKTVYIEMIRISQANYNTLKANGQLKPGAKYFIYDAQPVAVNAYNLPYSASQSTGQAIDLKLNKMTVFTAQATTSANGNIDLRNIINTNKYLVLQAVGLSGSAGVVVCIPYAYSSTDAGYIHGLHCINEYANMEVIANTQINLTLYTVEI